MNLSDIPEHHAIVIATHRRHDLGEMLWSQMRKDSYIHRDFVRTVFDIDTARDIISWAQTPHTGTKIGYVSFSTISVPAQNAMLKLLEEPPQGVRFIILTSHKEHLLPTFVSRVRVVEDVQHEREDVDERGHMADNSDAALFLETEPALRMKLPCVVKLLEQEDEEGRKDRESSAEFLSSIITLYGTHPVRNPLHTKQLLRYLSYAADASVSPKAIFEYVSLLIPRHKDVI